MSGSLKQIHNAVSTDDGAKYEAYLHSLKTADQMPQFGQQEEFVPSTPEAQRRAWRLLENAIDS